MYKQCVILIFIDISDDSFDREVLDDESLILVVFHASWCVSCKNVLPIIDEMYESYGDKLKVVKIDVDDQENGAIIEKYAIRSVPTTMLLKNTEPVEFFFGYSSKDQMISMIERNV